MALSKNIIYNSILTLSNYIIPLLVFPYVSRTLGVSNFGKVSFIESIINFVLLFSMFGIYNLGVREIAKCKGDKIRLNKTFSNLFILNSINSIVVFLIFLFLIFFIDKLNNYKNLLLLGSFNIIFNLFLIQWLYVGIEKFKFIVIRTLCFRLIYIVSIFLFVKNSNDYEVYYLLSVCLLFINAIVNWFYSRNYVKLSIKGVNIKVFIRSYFYLGLYSILTSFYTTFNLTFLGMVTNNVEIGYFTTAVKIQSVFLGLFTAISTAIVPHMSSLFFENKLEEFRTVILDSLDIILSLSIPIVCGCVILSTPIIEIISGNEFKGAAIPLKIISPTILIIGLAQIVVLQIMMPSGSDKIILRNSIVAAILGLTLNFILVKKYGAIGSSIVWLVSEVLVLLLSHYYVLKNHKINIFSNIFIKHILLGIPYIILCGLILIINLNPYLTLLLSLIMCFIYFSVIQLYVVKNKFILEKLKIKN